VRERGRARSSPWIPWARIYDGFIERYFDEMWTEGRADELSLLRQLGVVS